MCKFSISLFVSLARIACALFTRAYFLHLLLRRAKLLSYKFENCCEKSEVASSSIKPPGIENSKLSRKYIFDAAARHVWIRALEI